MKIFINKKEKGWFKEEILQSSKRCNTYLLRVCVFGLSDGTKKYTIRAVIGVSKSSIYKSVNKDKENVPAEEYKAPISFENWPYTNKLCSRDFPLRRGIKY